MTKLIVCHPPHILTEKLAETEIGRELRAVRKKLPAHWRPYIFGGLLTDLLVENHYKRPAHISDIDICVAGTESRIEFLRHLHPYVLKINSYGGLKCQLSEQYSTDIWRVEDHFPWHSPIPAKDIPEALDRVLLDVNGLAFDLDQGDLYDHGAEQAIITGRISLCQQKLSPAVVIFQAVHILMMGYKFQSVLQLDARPKQVVQDACTRAFKAEIRTCFIRKVERKYLSVERDFPQSPEEFFNDIIHVN